jgi:DNA-binding IclR family transcriptional regulator
MLRRESGASIRDLVAATGWQMNTIHSALTTLRKHGSQITVVKTRDGNRYRM